MKRLIIDSQSYWSAIWLHIIYENYPTENLRICFLDAPVYGMPSMASPGKMALIVHQSEFPPTSSLCSLSSTIVQILSFLHDTLQGMPGLILMRSSNLHYLLRSTRWSLHFSYEEDTYSAGSWGYVKVLCLIQALSITDSWSWWSPSHCLFFKNKAPSSLLASLNVDLGIPALDSCLTSLVVHVLGVSGFIVKSPAWCLGLLGQVLIHHNTTGFLQAVTVLSIPKPWTCP